MPEEKQSLKLSEKERKTLVQLLIERGITLYKEGKYEEALNDFNIANYHDCKNQKVLFYIGCCKYKQRNYPSARLHFNFVLSRNENHFYAWFMKGYILYKQNRNNEALEAFDKAIKIGYIDNKLLYKIGNIYIKSSRFDQALAVFNNILKNDPKDILGWMGKGKILNQMNMDEEAIVAFDTILSFDPQNIDARCMKAAIFYRSKQYHKTLGILLEVTDLDPRNIIAWFWIVLTSCKLGKHEIACKAYHKILQLGQNGELGPRHSLEELKNELFLSFQTTKEVDLLLKGQNAQIWAFNVGDFLLEALSSLGSATIEKFDFAIQTIIIPNFADEVHFRFNDIRHAYVRALEKLGHCEFDFTKRKMSVCEPALAVLPTRSPFKAVLVGARTEWLAQQVLNYSQSNGGTGNNQVIEQKMPVYSNDPCSLLLPIPSTYIIEAEGESGFIELCREYKIKFDPNNIPCYSLLEFSISLEGYRKLLTTQYLRDLSFEKRIFNPHILQFSTLDSDVTANSRLIEYKNPINHQYEHIYWREGHGAKVDRDWGRYLALSDSNINILVYDKNKELLGVPVTTPLPRILARAATFCSGMLPSHGHYHVHDKHGSINEYFIDLYRQVSSDIAQGIGQKLNQSLLHYKIESPQRGSDHAN